MDDTGLGFWGVPLAMLAGAIRVSTPFIFVSIGECLTERSGRINLGLEGTLVMGAMSAYGIALVSGSPWLGVLVAALVGLLLGALHAGICQLPRVNDIATGIGLMLFGTGLAFFLGKPFIQPKAPNLGAIDLGWWSSIPQVRQALQVNYLFLIGIVLAFALAWALKNTRWGLIVRLAGESVDAALAIGASVNRVRLIATSIGGAFAGIGGAFLSLYYPGSWNEGLSSGQGLMAVALVIFARWDPVRCLWASLLFGAAGAISPALQSVGVTQGYYLFSAAPYVLTLALMIATCSPERSLRGAPGELGAVKSEDLHARQFPPLCLAVERRSPAAQHRADRDRHADRLLRRRRLCRQDGLRPVADARADRADRQAAGGDAQGRLARHPYARGPSPRPQRPAAQQALALAADRRRHRRSGPLRPHPGARRAGLGDHSRARAASPASR